MRPEMLELSQKAPNLRVVCFLLVLLLSFCFVWAKGVGYVGRGWCGCWCVCPWHISAFNGTWDPHSPVPWARLFRLPFESNWGQDRVFRLPFGPWALGLFVRAPFWANLGLARLFGLPFGFICPVCLGLGLFVISCQIPQIGIITPIPIVRQARNHGTSYSSKAFLTDLTSAMG